MNERSLDQRIQAQLDLQAERKLGSQLREEAQERLLTHHTDMNPRQLQSWLDLLDSEEEDPIPGLSAGATALVMMEVRENYKRGYPSYHVTE